MRVFSVLVFRSLHRLPRRCRTSGFKVLKQQSSCMDAGTQYILWNITTRNWKPLCRLPAINLTPLTLCVHITDTSYRGHRHSRRRRGRTHRRCCRCFTRISAVILLFAQRQLSICRIAITFIIQCYWQFRGVSLPADVEMDIAWIPLSCFRNAILTLTATSDQWRG